MREGRNRGCRYSGDVEETLSIESNYKAKPSVLERWAEGE